MSLYEKLSGIYHELGWKYEELHVAVEDDNKKEILRLNDEINSLMQQSEELYIEKIHTKLP
ncbi:hypothetical protein HFE03_07845 [Paenibacillus sp. EKM102P]|uniref:hypothetical protein n=1 Tax=unclassified Paenibacillus TaxID=185978 RepID=UPI00142E3F13|nr:MULTISPECIES: hypothetical protein [unclassified Paenibacillus]KAF6620556.1 hypothetical protein HFE00_05750 [Paenibacillus sp. EKM101P]KAF6623548.1 hypothetical protein HFE03_07845 [Paenibacillus sp. EKM102P]KAF6633889.1 hypothetical protein HFE01_06665 [Paenibacillus sp. EKM10P]KAF6649416.1 hypothetical protein HFE02_01625 [Paenibacillus sp. EKM11P]